MFHCSELTCFQTARHTNWYQLIYMGSFHFASELSRVPLAYAQLVRCVSG